MSDDRKMAGPASRRIASLFLPYALFLISSLFIILIYDNASLFSGISNTISLLFSAAVALALLIAAVFALDRKKAHSKLIYILFAFFSVSCAALVFSEHMFVVATVVGIILTITHYAGLMILVLPAVALATIGAYLYRTGNRRLAVLLIAFGAVVLCASFVFGMTAFKVNDETLLNFAGSMAMLHGADPYSANLTSIVYSNRSVTGYSLSTNNTIVGKFDYPALSMLVSAPFYLLSQPTVSNLSSIDLRYEGAFLYYILILAVVFSVDLKYLKRPVFSIIAALVIEASMVAAVVSYLALALLVLAYASMDGRHSWIFMGLAVSLHQETWLPVLFMSLYYANNKGMRKGLENLAGIAAVFLLINSYFILQGPAAFVRDLFIPISWHLIPYGAAPFGWLILTNIGIMLSSFAYIFAIVVILLCAVLLYTNEKRLIGIFSVVPLLFLTRALPQYYAFFIALLIFSLFVSENPGMNVIGRELKKRKASVIAFSSIMLAAALYVIATSHYAYSSNYRISITPYAGPPATIGNTTLYRAVMANGNQYGHPLYVEVLEYFNYTVYYVFPYTNENGTLMMACSQAYYSCLKYVNRLYVNGSSSANLTAYLYTTGINGTNGINGGGQYRARVVIYNGDFFYISPAYVNMRGG
jgi:uncharacterized membrane protein